MIHPIKSIKARSQGYILKHFSITKYSRKIKKLKNTHLGESCFVIGNGPSLTAEDLSKIDLLGLDSFAANRIYKIFDKTDWRPTYFCCEDPVVIRDIQFEVNNIHCRYKFIPIDLHFYKDVNIDKAYYYNMQYKQDFSKNYGFVPCLENEITCNGTVTITAIQLAAYMGYKNIYLIGVDHSYAKMIGPNGEIIEDNSIKNYFDDSYDEKIKDELCHNVDETTKSFIRTRKYFEPQGINIYNATRGGKLEVFPRVNLDDILKGNE